VRDECDPVYALLQSALDEDSDNNVRLGSVFGCDIFSFFFFCFFLTIFFETINYLVLELHMLEQREMTCVKLSPNLCMMTLQHPSWFVSVHCHLG